MARKPKYDPDSILNNIPALLDEEDKLLDKMDQYKALERVMPILERLNKGQISPKKAMELAGPLLTEQAFKFAFGDNIAQKIQADMVRHILAINGIQPAQKIEVTKVDADTPRESILSIIRGLTKEAREQGIEIVEDIEDVEYSKEADEGKDTAEES